jgi:hypothetical protein
VRLGTSLLEIDHGFVPYLTPDGAMGHMVDLFGQSVGIMLVEYLDQLRVQQTAPFLEQTAIGHLVGQGVLKDVCTLREQARLIQEFGRLEMY